MGNRLARLLLAAMVLACAPAAAQVAEPPPSKCTAQKYKAASLHVARLAACKAKARRAGVRQDSACVARSLVKFEAAFARAERKGDCVTTADGQFIDFESSQFMTSLTARLDRQRLCCEIPADDVCFYAADAGDCAEFTGVLGPEGSVCQPSGACENPPELQAPCCQASNFGFGPSCVMSPIYIQTNCDSIGGTFHPSSICSQVDGCAP